MSRRTLIPLSLLAILVVLAAVFAVIGASSSPSAETVTVQNASTRTFGTPTGSVSFLAGLTDTASGPSVPRGASQQRIIQYAAPMNRIAVYQVTSSGSTQPLGVVHGTSVSCALSSFSTIVGGSTAWAAAGGGNYTRSESLADFSARVPDTSSRTCESQQSRTQGQVTERALVKSDYLVALRVTIVVRVQSQGRSAGPIVQGQQLVMIQIGKTPVRTLS